MAKKLLSLVRNETGQLICLVIAGLVILWAYGCESVVTSLRDNGKMVTRDELDLELQTYLATAEIRFRQLDRQDSFKRILFEKTAAFAKTGEINPFGLLSTLFAILGVGAIADNVRKRITIRKNLTETVNNARAKAERTP